MLSCKCLLIKTVKITGTIPTKNSACQPAVGIIQAAINAAKIAPI